MSTSIRNQKLHCDMCGNEKPIPFPIPIIAMTEMIDMFTAQHKKCKKQTWNQPMPTEGMSVPEKASFWFQFGEKGSSSLAIYETLTSQRNPKTSHPYDPSDFRRCHGLLLMVPEWRNELHKMQKVSDAWNNLVNNWDDLTLLLKEQMENPGVDNGMYKKMEALIR